MTSVFKWSDPESWAPLCGSAASGRQRLAHRFRASYTHIALFHAGRPQSPDSYCRHGIQLSDSEGLDSLAEEVFLGGAFPALSKNALQAAAIALGPRDHGRLFMVLDERELLRYAGHYLVYGSERLIAIAVALGRGSTTYRDHLRCRGVPTLIEAEVPISKLPAPAIDDLARRIAQIPAVRRRQPQPPLDFTFTLRLPIEPHEIVHITHPKEIPDPLEGGAIYRW